MHDTRVKMKDGREYCSPKWDWRPREGWFSLVNDGDLLIIQLDDVESAVEEGQRVGVLSPGVPKIEDVDLLARAREEGWVPCTTT